MQMPLFSTESSWRAKSPSDWPTWSHAPIVSIDLEARDEGLNNDLGPGQFRPDSYVCGIGVGLEDGTAIYLPVAHAGGDNVENPEAAWAWFRDNLSAFTGIWTGANIGYDKGWTTSRYKIKDQASKYYDVLHADTLLYELHHQCDLDAVCKRWGVPGKDKTKLLEASKNYGLKNPAGEMWKLPGRFVGAYNEADLRGPLALLPRLTEALKKGDLWDLYDKIEAKIIPILVKMRERGMPIDTKKLEEVELWALEEEKRQLILIKSLSGRELRVDECTTPKSLAAVLQAQGVQVPLAAKGKVSIKDAWLERLPKETGGPAMARARQVNKLRNTFCRSTWDHMIKGRIHCSGNQLRGTDERLKDEDDPESKGARTGRFSFDHPNLTQVPSRADFAPAYKSIFLPEQGMLWGSGDFCFSSDTDVLTQRGFIPFVELTDTDTVAQYDRDTKQIDFVFPISKQRIVFNGEAVRIYGPKSIDMLVTPSHNCLVYTNGVSRVVKATDYPLGARHHQVLAGNMQSRGSMSVTDEELITSVAVQADGSLRTGHYRIWISKMRKVDRCINHVTHTSSYTCAAKSGQTAFIVPLDAAPLLEPGADKNFSRAALYALPLQQRRQFIQELLLWDGSGSFSAKAVYATTNKHNAYLVQEVAILSGIKAQISLMPVVGDIKQCYLVGFSKKDRCSTETLSKTNVPYNDEVFCVTMPLGTVVVRRGGKVAITCQSQQEPRLTTHYAAKRDLRGAREAARAFRDNELLDNHTFMSEITGQPRKQAKNIYLGVCYSMGEAKLCRSLGLPTQFCVSWSTWKERQKMYFPEEYKALAYCRALQDETAEVFECAGAKGKAILDQFHARAPFLKEISDAAKKNGAKYGEIITLLGRHLHLPVKPNGKYDWIWKCLNMLIQGSAADMMKASMIAVDEQMPDVWIAVSVHDMLGGSFHNVGEIKQMCRIMRSTVISEYVPFCVHGARGPSWGQEEELCYEQWCNEMAKSKDDKWCPQHAPKLAAERPNLPTRIQAW